jgi:gamma-glutamyltranspeptidase/glutathione hydrolase
MRVPHAVLSLALLTACAGAGSGGGGASAPRAVDAPSGRSAPAGGAAASSESHATQVAADVLAAGGNAVDAAIALHFALAVTYPYAGNLGGGGFLVYHAADGGDWFLDFRETAPAAAGPDFYRGADGSVDAEASRLGWKAVGVPGAVPGMWEAHRRWGSLPWRDLVLPAARLAEEGFRLTPGECVRLERAREDLARDPRAAAVFLVDGAVPEPGSLLRQPTLAGTLRRIAEEGEAPLRDGPLVEALIAASDAGGGALTAADFRDYRPVLRPLYRIAWRGLEVLAPGAPSSGGVFLGQMLPVLEERPLAEWGFDDPRTVQFLGEASAAAFRDRNAWLGDPAGFDFDVRGLLDPGYLAARAAALSERRFTAPDASLPAPPVEHGETTHFSVMDGAGGAVSCTTTLNGLYGAKVMAPGGFLMNNEMDDFAAAPGEPNQFGLVQGKYNAVRAGRRPLSSMAPVLVLRDGQVDAVIGSPGGPTILSSVLQVLLNRYLFEMAPRAAVAAPRLHRQDLPPDLQYEPRRLDGATRAALEGLGQPLRERTPIGDVNAVFRTPRGLHAVADPRHEGLGVVVGLVAAQAPVRR